MSDAVNSAVAYGSESGGGGAARRSRQPRWTRPEILALIKGKKVIEGLRRSRPAAGSAPAVAGPAEPKWVAIAAYCGRRGMDRSPMQCRKRWSNLTCDFKKVREWERGQEAAKGAEWESFWSMGNDRKRERKLPGRFDREVFGILDGAAEVGVEEEEEDEAIFDSGRSAADDGLFSEDDVEEEEEEEEEGLPAEVVMPISERKCEPFHQVTSDPGMVNDEPFIDIPEKGSSSQGQKRKRTSQDDADTLQNQLIHVLERNSRVLTAQLEAQNINCQLDRDQRKDHGHRLLNVLSKLADALGKIADKL